MIFSSFWGRGGSGSVWDPEEASGCSGASWEGLSGEELEGVELSGREASGSAEEPPGVEEDEGSEEDAPPEPAAWGMLHPVNRKHNKKMINFFIAASWEKQRGEGISTPKFRFACSSLWKYTTLCDCCQFFCPFPWFLKREMEELHGSAGFSVWRQKKRQAGAGGTSLSVVIR